MALCDLPNELLQLIVEFLDSESSINALAGTKRAFFVQFNPFLYRYHVSMKSKNRLIDESAKFPLPSPAPGNNLDESGRT